MDDFLRSFITVVVISIAFKGGEKNKADVMSSSMAFRHGLSSDIDQSGTVQLA